METEENPLTETPGPSSPSGHIELSTPVTEPAIRDLVSLLCLVHQREQSREMDQVYWLGLSDLSMAQARRLGEMIPRETEFWPSPCRLRKLLGIQSTEDLAESEAAHVLECVLTSLEPHVADPKRREGWIEHVKANKPPSDPVLRAITRIGSGSFESGVEWLALHPRFRGAGDARESLSYELTAIEKLEARWLAAWRGAD